MPTCCIKNCSSRSSGAFSDNVMFYTFPKNADLRRKWLEACRKDVNHQINHERVCKVHFKAECIEKQLTKPQSKKSQPRIIRRLKKRSVPTEFLDLPSKRKKRLHSFPQSCAKESPEKLICTGVPTYTELITCSKDAVCASDLTEVQTSSVENNIRKENMDLTKETGAAIVAKYTECTNSESANLSTSSVEEHIQKEGIGFTIGTGREVECSNSSIVDMLLARLREIEKENAELKVQLHQKCVAMDCMKEDAQKHGAKIATDILRRIFTSGQVKRLMSPTNRRIAWTIEDIRSAIALRSISSKAYIYLREVQKIPLPSITTLKQWIANFTVKPGILIDVLHIMELQGQNLSTPQKLTILTFDEIYIANKVDLERREQKIYGPHKTCQVMIARGLFFKWKHPNEYSQPMTKDILLEIIDKLYKIGYTVVATTYDMGSTNMALRKDLNIGIETKEKKNCTKKQCFFIHPTDKSLKIYVFADVPHLMKLLRNHFLDSGFDVDGHHFNKCLLEELLHLNCNELKIAFNLTRTHLDVKGFQRQRVKLAAQIFSLRNARALEYCGQKGYLSKDNWQAMADMFKLVNNWFDILNSQSKFGNHSGSRAYGVALEEQNTCLDEMSNFISKMRVTKKSCLLPFQKGILLSNKSLKKLLLYLKEKYSDENFQPEYIITRKLSQDILENFFSYIRGMGATNDHPSPVDFRNRLKWYILGKHSEHAMSTRGNVEVDKDSFTDFKDVQSNIAYERHILDDLENNDFAAEAILFTENSNVENSAQNTDEKNAEEGEVDSNGTYCGGIR